MCQANIMCKNAFRYHKLKSYLISELSIKSKILVGQIHDIMPIKTFLKKTFPFKNYLMKKKQLLMNNDT